MTLHLQTGTDSIVLDVLDHLSCAKNASIVLLKMDDFPELKALIKVMQFLFSVVIKLFYMVKMMVDWFLMDENLLNFYNWGSIVNSLL